MAKAARVAPEKTSDRSGPFTDLALTLPVFVGYHLGVVFLPVRNAADVVTQKLQDVAAYDLWVYAGLTLLIGAAYVTPLVLAGRGKHLEPSRFAWLGTEGILYAIAMRLLAGAVVAQLVASVASEGGGVLGLMKAAPAVSASVEAAGQASALGERLAGAVMSLGAGFYEELVFRVGLYGLGSSLLLFLLGATGVAHRFVYRLAWALIAACLFSGWHYVGSLGDDFDLTTFSFRAVCGLVFTIIYQLRGFAPAVWTHALYDLWVLAL
jgi:membrane protease YdiL (CAAX protease family)